MWRVSMFLDAMAEETQDRSCDHRKTTALKVRKLPEWKGRLNLKCMRELASLSVFMRIHKLMALQLLMLLELQSHGFRALETLLRYISVCPSRESRPQAFMTASTMSSSL